VTRVQYHRHRRHATYAASFHLLLHILVEDARGRCAVSIRQHTSAYVSIRQHTSAYVSISQHTSTSSSRMREDAAPQLRQYLYCCTSKANAPSIPEIKPLASAVKAPLDRNFVLRSSSSSFRLETEKGTYMSAICVSSLIYVSSHSPSADVYASGWKPKRDIRQQKKYRQVLES
jgi:hypothetical protein